MSVDCTPDTEYEVYFRADKDVITFTLGGPFTGVAAYDSDKVRPVAGALGMMHYHPAGSRIFYRPDNPGSRFAILNVDPGLRAAVTDGFDRRVGGLETRINIPSSLAVGIGRAVQVFVSSGGARLVAESLATLAVAESMRVFAQPAGCGPALRPGSAQRAIDRACAYIEENLDGDLGLADIAAVAAMSLYHFSRTFKSVTGETPGRYVMIRRVERARTLLQSTQAPLSEIAFTCGFASQSHMTAVFRTHIGATPGQYRRTVRT